MNERLRHELEFERDYCERVSDMMAGLSNLANFSVDPGRLSTRGEGDLVLGIAIILPLDFLS